MSQYEIVTLGETMIRFTPLAFKRIEQSDLLHIEVGGSESNLSVGLARLGLRVAWISRLPDSALGRYVANTIRGYGVDTRYVVWSDSDRLGLYFVEEGPAPRGASVIYDRADSAMSRMQPSELPDALFAPGAARQLHLSGITVAISDSAAQTAWQAARRAKEAGWKLSFDLNYRAKLWSPAAAAAGCERFMQLADILILPQRDGCLLYEIDATLPPTEIIHKIAQRFPPADIVMTTGADGAIGLPQGSQEAIVQPAFAADGPGRIGGGDAFGAGFFYGYHRHPEAPVAAGLRWGVATAAIKLTTPDDIPVIDKADVEALLRGPADVGGVKR